MHWLCRIGIHRWDFHCEVKDGWVTDTSWCTRPDCRYSEPMIVNHERSLVGASGEAPFPGAN